jgi:hypothetical protein
MLMVIIGLNWISSEECEVNLMKQLTKPIDKSSKTVESDRWNEGLVNHEKLKKLLPFLNEDEGYL